MRSIAFADFLIGVGILFVLEGLMFAASPAWMRRAMKSALATPDNILRVVGIGSAGPRPLPIFLGRPPLPRRFPPPKKRRRDKRSRTVSPCPVLPSVGPVLR